MKTNSFPMPIYFAIPGDINTLTGGYGYDRRLIQELRQSGLEIIHLPLSSKFPQPDVQALEETADILASLASGSLVVVDGLALGVMDQIAKEFTQRLRLVALCHHPLMYETGLSSSEQQKLYHSEKRALDAVALVIVTSDTTRNILIEEFSVPPQKIIVAKPGNDQQQPALCAGNPPILLTVASLTRRKGHDVLINALGQLKDFSWIAHLVGGDHFDPQWAAHLRTLVAEHQLEDRIIFKGSVTNIDEVFSAADIFVLPSHFEGYGMVFSEAISFGLPILATRAGAIPDLVPDTAGILVPPGDVNALTEALKTLLLNPSLRKHLQQGAQDCASRLPRWKDTAQIVSDAIQSLLTSSGLQESP